jgi:hypothetical protein
VITIIILLILATISIQSLTNTGLFQKANEAKEKTQNAAENQAKILNEYEDELNKYISGNVEKTFKGKTVTDAIQYADVLNKNDNTELQDAYGNKIVVPAGFKIVSNDDTSNATTVDKGIVIEDATSAATAGSQFVWIPVGKIYTDVAKTEANAKTIELGRYEFDSNSNKSAYSGSYVEEDKGDTNTTLKNYGNTIAKNITNFKNSVASNGGYYIGRYEARTTNKRTAEGNALTQITEKGTDQIYNYVKQPQAAKLSQEMYNSNKFTSDLMNSYAWDTATLFLQTCGEEKYSRKTSVNNSLASKGTNSSDYTGTRDTVCNVYDMASNVTECTTETSDSSNSPCVERGGFCYSGEYTSKRNNLNTSYNNVGLGFRPLLYVGLNS